MVLRLTYLGDLSGPGVPRRGARFELGLEEGKARVVGRREEVDLRFEHESVGRRALTVTLRAGEVVVDDRGSGGGSRLNDQDLPRGAPLRTGDTLVVGALAFRVELIAP